ncbi:hypothetical protein STCU_10333 [Strigomonas culicis]|uniref:Uncharacterized protein n=1 Tax=Strigomonas culicis TaxID=28005 RepID=S9TNE7_9TRYP|nr:hypothetical protein STCU_10333 [Strigomonas culicis]|eukprot:EPY17913.1 hypothetical protein STCU_10333 [Strigomonas culicis]
MPPRWAALPQLDVRRRHQRSARTDIPAAHRGGGGSRRLRFARARVAVRKEHGRLARWAHLVHLVDLQRLSRRPIAVTSPIIMITTAIEYSRHL